MQIAFLTFSLDLSCFNIALDLFHTLASEPQLFGRAAVGKPICIVGHTNQVITASIMGVSTPAKSPIEAQQTSATGMSSVR